MVPIVPYRIKQGERGLKHNESQVIGKTCCHLHVVHAHYVSTVVHVLLQVLILRGERRRDQTEVDAPRVRYQQVYFHTFCSDSVFPS